MKIEHTHFAMIPAWVVAHPAVRGHLAMIGTYVAVRIAAHEQPDHDWRSERELAVYLGEIIGQSGEGVRKNLRDLRKAKVVLGDAGRLVLPSDPHIGDASGDENPQSGDNLPQSGDNLPPVPSYRDLENAEKTRGSVGTHSDARRLAEMLAHSLGNREGAKRPTVTAQWVTDMDHLLRLDGRTAKEVEGVIRWLERGADDVAAFWRPNVRSPRKLRARWDQMAEAYAAQRKKARRSRGDDLRAKIDRMRALDDDPE